MPLGGPLTLVDKPPAYEKITVRYATKANHVDVKALKHKMWKELCTEEETHKVRPSRVYSSFSSLPGKEQAFYRKVVPRNDPSDASTRS